MLSFIIAFAVAVLMIWALSPGPTRRRGPSHSVHPSVDATSLPVVDAGGLPFGSSSFGSGCDAGGGGCDAGGG